jgi:hypothetical protein
MHTPLMRTPRLLMLTLVTALVMALSTSSAFAKYGWQCFQTKSRHEYCSCTKFKNHDEAREWIRHKLAELADDPAKKPDQKQMRPGSDRVVTEGQPDDCEN